MGTGCGHSASAIVKSNQGYLQVRDYSEGELLVIPFLGLAAASCTPGRPVSVIAS